MNSTEISVKNFSISIENREILKNISVDIPKNQITVIIGPSGCGKSTLLRSMNRMTDLVEQVKTDGEIVIGGRNVLDPAINLSQLRKNVGMIAQAPNPLPMSIYENVVFGLRIHGGENHAAMAERAEQCLRTVGLWNEVHDRLRNRQQRCPLGSSSGCALHGRLR